MADMGSDANAAAEIDLGRVVDALPALVWTTQDDGRCDFVNRRWCEYTGIEPKIALDHGWQRAIHPDDLRPFLDAWNAIRQSGVAKEIDGRLRRSDGEYRWYVFRPSLMAEVPGRSRWCWLGSFADEGLETDGRLRRLWDALPWQAGFLDKTGVLEFTNLQSLKDFGMTKKQLEEWSRSGIFHLDDHERHNMGSRPTVKGRTAGPADAHALPERRLSVDACTLRPGPRRTGQHRPPRNIPS